MSAVRLLMIRSTKSYGGPERQIVGFARRLNPKLFCPIICTFSDTLGWKNPLLEVAASFGLKTCLIPTERAFDKKGVYALKQIIEEHKIDMLCPQDYRANVYAFLATRGLNIPLGATVHGYAGNTNKVRLYEFLDRIVLRAMHKIVCVSDALRTRLRRYGLSDRKLNRVYNSIDPEEILPVASNGGGKSKSHIVCSVGRLSVEKGHRFLLNAWRYVVEHLKNAQLVLVGDGPEMPKLLRQAQALGIESSVRFIGHTSRPLDYLRECDVFVLPSLTEGLPIALLEACAIGKPVIASNVGGVGEVVIPGYNGLLVRSKQPMEIASAIIDILTHVEVAVAMGAHGRQLIEEKFSFKRNVPLLEEVYLSCIGDSVTEELLAA